MRIAAFIASVCIAGGAELDPRLLRLLDSTVLWVTASDAQKMRSSRLAGQLRLDDPSLDDAGTTSSVAIQYKGGALLFVSIGRFQTKLPPSSKGYAYVSPEADVRIEGPPGAVKSAVANWKGARKEPSSISMAAAAAGSAQDFWLVVIDPLQDDEFVAELPSGLANWERLRESVKEVSAGIRFGPSNEVRMAIRMSSEEDARAVAAAARFAPALLQRGAGELGALVASMEDFQARRSGTTVELSAVIPEAKVKAR